MVTNTVSSTTNMIQSASISPTPNAVHNAAESTSSTRRVSDNRRSNKPIMEKRRRARINNCLNELKTLILDAMKKDPARHSKLEKADILEMTVKHLRNIQRQQAAISANTDPNLINMFRAGFFECANEIGRISGINPVIKRRLLQHLAHYIDKNLKQQDVPQLQVHILPTDKKTENQLPQSSGFILSNTNGTDVQLLSRLSNANIAIVLPPAVQQQYAANSNSPVPLLVPIVPAEQERSTSAASVSSSSISCSPSHSPDVMDDMYYQPKPLSLVVRKNVEPAEEKPWRPW